MTGTSQIGIGSGCVGSDGNQTLQGACSTACTDNDGLRKSLVVPKSKLKLLGYTVCDQVVAPKTRKESRHNNNLPMKIEEALCLSLSVWPVETTWPMERAGEGK